MGESTFDGRMIGPNGNVVTYPQWFFAVILNSQRRLIRIAKEKTMLTGRFHAPVRVIERDKASGFWRVLPEIKVQLGALLDMPHQNPNKKMHSFNPGYSSGRPRVCGRRPLMDMLECGIDTTNRDMRECEADLQESRIAIRDIRTRQLVREVKARRVIQ